MDENKVLFNLPANCHPTGNVYLTGIGYLSNNKNEFAIIRTDGSISVTANANTQIIIDAMFPALTP